MKSGSMKIGTRLALGFGTVLALLISLAVLSLLKLGESNARLDRILHVNNAEIQLVNALSKNASDRMLAARNVALLTDMAEMKPEVDRAKGLESEFPKLLAKLQDILDRTGGNETEKSLMSAIANANSAMAAPVAMALELGVQNKAQEATEVLIKNVRPPQRKLQSALADLGQEEQRQNNQLAAEAESSYQGARILLIGISLAAIAAGAAIAWLVTRSITRPLGEAVSVAGAVAAGDLTTKVQVRSGDETGQLMEALRTMNDSLASVVTRVRSGTDAIATASGQIASGNRDLSQRTEEQASSLEETAASMEELTGTVKQNADNARQANQLAQSAAEVAVKGGAVVGQVVETMAEINGSSKKIADIIAVIDGIAFQTNILALNAAVEAARAGEQGRGFAVVAAEVRSLAQRSAAAAKEIKALIDDSVGKVETGTELVGRAGETMQEIVASVQRVTDIMGEIAAASQEQTRGIEQVNQAITQMDQVTQQNAALVEEAAAAAQSMREQSEDLVHAVSVFKTGAESAAAQAIDQARLSSTKVLSGTKRIARNVPTHRGGAASQGAEAPAIAAANDDWQQF